MVFTFVKSVLEGGGVMLLTALIGRLTARFGGGGEQRRTRLTEPFTVKTAATPFKNKK